jgi:hypothetical protein
LLPHESWASVAAFQYCLPSNKPSAQVMPAIPSAKQATLKLVERLDEEVSFEDIIYELYVLEKIQCGMKDAEQGRVVGHEEAGERLEQWLK